MRFLWQKWQPWAPADGTLGQPRCQPVGSPVAEVCNVMPTPLSQQDGQRSDSPRKAWQELQQFCPWRPSQVSSPRKMVSVGTCKVGRQDRVSALHADLASVF